MMEKNSQAYQLLTLICMSGECSEKAISIFIPDQDQRNRLLAKLIANKLVKKYQKDNMPGLRLTRKSKEFLYTSEPNRFSLYLSNGADYSMRRSSIKTRNRQHGISETVAMIQRVCMEKYQRQADKPNISTFLSAKEVKSNGTIINSKLTGVWLNENSPWMCYHTAEESFFWYENVEKRAAVLVHSMIKTAGTKSSSVNALLFGNTITQSKMCLENPKMPMTLQNSHFHRFCFIPLDENGIILLQLLKNRELYENLFSILTEDLHKKEMNYILNDGYNKDGLPVLVCIDCDLKRLVSFKTQLDYANCSGEVICFDFQKTAIQEFCNDNIEISTVDSEKVRELFLSC